MKVASLVVLSLAMLGTALPARADLRPPPLERPAGKTPAEAKRWLLASVQAMKSGDAAQARRLCDARGYDQNLVGPSGTPLEDLFAQGARKGWHLEARFDNTRRLSAGRGAILRAFVVDNQSGKELDELWLLLVRAVDPAGEPSWLALGAGENAVQVDALARRFIAGEPLAPPSDDKTAPKTE